MSEPERDPRDLLAAVREIQRDIAIAEFEQQFPSKWDAYQFGRRNERMNWIKVFLVVVGIPLAGWLGQLLIDLLKSVFY